jgi:hypothetical protein
MNDEKLIKAAHSAGYSIGYVYKMSFLHQERESEERSRAVRVIAPDLESALAAFHEIMAGLMESEGGDYTTVSVHQDSNECFVWGVNDLE